MIIPNNELQFASTYYFLNLVFYQNDYCNSTVFTDVHTMVNLQEKNDFLTQCTVKKVICLWKKRETARNYPIKFFEMNVVNRRRLFKVFAKDQWKVRERPPQPEGNYFDRNHLHSTLNHSLACWLDVWLKEKWTRVFELLIFIIPCKEIQRAPEWIKLSVY